VLAFADVVELLTHEFAGLRRWRLAFTLVTSGSFERRFFWHD
jgi:hypothetical protein